MSDLFFLFPFPPALTCTFIRCLSSLVTFAVGRKHLCCILINNLAGGGGERVTLLTLNVAPIQLSLLISSIRSGDKTQNTKCHLVSILFLYSISPLLTSSASPVHLLAGCSPHDSEVRTLHHSPLKYHTHRHTVTFHRSHISLARTLLHWPRAQFVSVAPHPDIHSVCSSKKSMSLHA